MDSLARDNGFASAVGQVSLSMLPKVKYMGASGKRARSDCRRPVQVQHAIYDSIQSA